MAGGGHERKLDQTPTWAVAGVCAVIILFSLALEKGLHKIGMWLTRKHRRALYEALERIKGELMVMGFISLLLTFSQRYIRKICIKSNMGNTMLPCEFRHHAVKSQRRSLSWNDHRMLVSSAFNQSDTCSGDYEPLITPEGVHELHILIFLLAFIHVLYSAITMLLGRLKIRGWKEWENETAATNYEFANDHSTIRLAHETTFVKAHSSFWTRMTFFFYVGCFFRQFYRSVTKTDYMTLRNGFVTTHLAAGRKFDFQKYIKRSLEDDFKVVVGVSPLLWASFIIFLLLNVNGWHTLFWASILPLIIILAVGTKLQAILAKMALEIKDRHSVVKGMPLVQGSDSYFWLSKPQLLLHLLHFSLFQNAFQVTYLLWILYNFGLYSCFHDKVQMVVTKIVFGVGALVLCSYSTLPLYALVTQMGSHMKKSIFDEQTSNALKRWHMAAKKKQEETSKRSPPQTLGGNSKISNTSFRRHPYGPPLHRFMTTGHSTYSDTCDEHDKSNAKHDEQSLLANIAIAVEDDNGECELSMLPHEEESRDEDDTD